MGRPQSLEVVFFCFRRCQSNLVAELFTGVEYSQLTTVVHGRASMNVPRKRSTIETPPAKSLAAQDVDFEFKNARNLQVVVRPTYLCILCIFKWLIENPPGPGARGGLCWLAAQNVDSGLRNRQNSVVFSGIYHRLLVLPFCVFSVFLEPLFCTWRSIDARHRCRVRSSLAA